MDFFKTPAYRFRVNGRNVGFFENDDDIHRISIVLVISCGRAKTIPIRQRILRKYSKLKKKHYCVRRGKALEFLRVSLRDTVPIMHMHERLLVISCGRAKTIPIRQRILRKYSKLKKKHYCVRRGKALEFLRVSLRDTVPIMPSTKDFSFLKKTCHDFVARSAAWRP